MPDKSKIASIHPASEQGRDEDETAERGANPVAESAPRAREIGGREGPDPTRYGDWEKAGRCIDF